MSQTFIGHRAMLITHNGHRHKAHLIIVEDCDADDRFDPCDRTVGDIDPIFDMMLRALGAEKDTEN